MDMAQKITPFLMFDDQAEEAMALYTSLFPNARIVSTMPGPAGKVMGGSIEIDGERINMYNGGPTFRFEQGNSLMVRADSQEEIDRLYDGLAADGGETQPCSWVRDKFGVSWQIVPPVLLKGLSDPKTAGRVAEAMFKMKKIIIADIQAAMVE